MPMTTAPEWTQLALYAGGAALVLLVLLRLPYVGKVVRFALSFGLLAFFIFLLFQQAQVDPTLSRLTERLGLGDQQVTGQEVRIRMSPDGHFWANASINGIERRMLVDSGATITAVSAETARLAGIERGASLTPVMVRTANGVVRAETGVAETIGMEGITAENLRVVVSPAFGRIEVLGMNFLSRLRSWRVEGQTLILEPHSPEEDAGSPVERSLGDEAAQ